MFEKIKTKKLPYKTSDLPSHPSTYYDLPALTAGIENQGLNNYVPRSNATVLKNVISISANGANTGVTFYQNSEFTVLQDAYAIKWIFNNNSLSDNQFLFLTSTIRKAIYGNYDWSNKAGWEKIKNDKILLPITQNGEIDFKFMESFVAELEAERVAELEAYLAAASLKDYELTAAELSALSKFENYNWGEFRIGDLFEKLSAKFLGKGDKFKAVSKIKTTEFFVPIVYCKFGDNGIMYWAKKNDFETYKNVISIVYNGAIAAGKVYAQPHETGILAESYFIKFKNREIDFKVNLFFQCVLEKVLYPKYSRDYLATWDNKVENDVISLPITDNGEIDFEFMNNFIKAIEKLVIKDVVLYTDNKIKATKSIVSSNQ